ncbi:SDR family NAD(P)-dependent oxidoreductase [Streptomyces sp. NPDC051018]|uniref:SDR family NAD(P)-dependent oxidoreductase n=1 Tax=Streptomyces sp. NPDC051018 TaxID=3365639 RepID=UPI0037B719BC
MSGRLDGRVAVVTGAGRGLGRAHALELARHGAKVVVNDLGGDVHGGGEDGTVAGTVVEEIRAAGGEAVAGGQDVCDWRGAQELIALAVETFGDLHVLVNNAGIVRDRALVNMSEEEWDAVVRVHLKGHAAPTHHAMAYWRERARAGAREDRCVVMTSSLAGLIGNFGQANYATAKLGVLALSQVTSIEGEKYGVRSNTVSPGGRTRIAASADGGEQAMAPPGSGFDPLDPAHVSPLIAWLAASGCPADRQVFQLVGARLIVSALPPVVHDLRSEGRWTLEALDEQLPGKLVTPLGIESWFSA